MKATFVPSQVGCPFVPNSSLKKTEAEILFALVMTFLAKNGDDWETVVEVRPFFEHSQQEECLPPPLRDPFHNPVLAQGVVSEMHRLVRDGYIEWVEERASFRITQKFIDFFEQQRQAV